MRTRPCPGIFSGYQLLVAVLAAYFFAHHPAQAFPMQDDQTAGSMANDWRKRANFWQRFELGVLDGKIKTSPPDSHRYDRRIALTGQVGAEGFFKNRFGARVNLKGEYIRKRMSDDMDSPTIIDHNRMIYHPSLDFTFVTDKGLELFAGLVGEIEPKNEVVSDTQSGNSSTYFGASTMFARRFGVVRRSGVWSGGFYYQLDTDGDRSVKQTAFDGTSVESTEKLFMPARMGIFGAFNAYKTIWDFELGFVQARGLGARDDTGNTALTDHFEAKLNSTYMLSGWGLKLGANHRTQSYANSAYINIDTIPATTVRALVLIGAADWNNFIGVIYGFGEDGQSLPEFNSSYEYKAAALTAGLFIPL